MSLYSKIRGTIERAFSLGLAGPQVKVGDSSDQLDARNSDDTDFARVRVADPIDADDAVNLRTLEDRIVLLNKQIALLAFTLVATGIDVPSDLTASMVEFLQ